MLSLTACGSISLLAFVLYSSQNRPSSSNHNIVVPPLVLQLTGLPLCLPKLKISTPFTLIIRLAKSTISSSPVNLTISQW